MKKCFTINPTRNTEDFLSYYQLFEEEVFQAVELFYPYLLSVEGRNTYYNNALKFLKYKAEMVLHLPHGPKNDLCDLNNYHMIIRRMKEAIDFGKRLDVEKYTIHLGYINNQKREDLINHIVGILRELCDYAKPALLMIENMPGNGELGYSPNEILSIINKVDRSNIKFILDTGHAHVSEYDISEYINSLFPYLSHIHLSDNKGSRDEHAPIGTGTIPFNNVFNLLKKYQGLFCLEILFNDANDLRNYSKTLDEYF